MGRRTVLERRIVIVEARKQLLTNYLRFIKKTYIPKIRCIDRCLRIKEGLDGEGTMGLYGTITFGSQMRLTCNLMANGELPHGPHAWDGLLPVVVDFGAGTGRALAFWQMFNMVSRGVGFEFDSNKVQRAEPYMSRLASRARFKHGLPVRTDLPTVLMQDLSMLPINDVEAYRPTFGYSFCAGISMHARRAMGRIFESCSTMKALVLVEYADNSLDTVLRSVGLLDKDEQAESFLAKYNARRLDGLHAIGGNGSYTAHIITKK